MSCNKCSGICSTCNCTCNSTKICQEPVNCSCPTLLSTDCITLSEDLPCSNILKGQTETEVLKQLSEFICTKFDSVTNFFDLINVGAGAQVYKGVSMLGKKEIRTLVDSGLINIVQGTNDITISVDETALNTFIEANQKTYSASNIGTGANVYKDTTIVGDNTQLNLRKINTSNSGTGEEILKAQVENTNDISIIGKTLISTSLTISSTADEIFIEVPTVSEIPALIVNSAYTGDEELGTASKPFKTIQGALDAYVGTGGKGTIADPTNPELLGSIIRIEKGAGTYSFTGDFDYKDIYVSLKEGTVINSTPTGLWLMDFTSFATTTTHTPILNFEEGAQIYCNKNGFRIEGGDFAIGTNDRKTLKVNGDAAGLVLVGTLESDILFEVDGANLQYGNGGYPHLEISSAISTNRGRIFVIKGNGTVVCNSNIIFIVNDSSSAVITNTYPPIELRNNALLRITDGQVTISKTPSTTYNQLIYLDDTSKAEFINTTFAGETVYFTYNNSAGNTSNLEVISCKMDILTTTSFAQTVSGVWELALNNNNMPSTIIDPLTTSITPSAVNTIDGKIIETLDTYSSKASAVMAGLPTGAKFINKVNVTAGAFVVGLEYKILTIGSTDFTSIGASANTVGLYFTASGAGTGTGTASLIRVDIVI